MPYPIHPRTNNDNNMRRNTRRPSQTHKDAGLTWNLAFSLFVVTLGSFQYGFSLTLNVPVKDMVKWYNHIYFAQHTKFLVEAQAMKWIASGISIMYLAAIIGSFLSVYVSDHFGRLRSLQVSDLVAICGAVILGNARQAASIQMIIVGKFLEGLSMGMLSIAVPLYLVEVAPFKMRGAIVALHALGISLGALTSPVFGLVLGTYWRWHVLLGMFAIPSACQLVLSLCIPESPRYLFITQDDEYSAKRALQKLRGRKRKHCIRDEMEQMGFEVEAQHMLAPSQNLWHFLCNVNLRKALFTAIIVHISQSIFRIDAGMLYIVPFISNALPFTTFIFLVSLALLTVLLTMLAVGIIAKYGIRSIFFVNCTCMTACAALLTIFMLVHQFSSQVWPAYIGFLLMSLYKCFFAMGPGVVPWVLSTQLFTQNVRSKALCMCLLTNWVGDIVIGIFFALFYQWIKSFIWLMYTMLLALFLFVAFKIVPEIKGKTFLDLARQCSTSYHQSLIPL